MAVHQETYNRASLDKRRHIIATKCAQKVDQIQSEIASLKLNSTVSAPKMTALELRNHLYHKIMLNILVLFKDAKEALLRTLD